MESLLVDDNFTPVSLEIITIVYMILPYKYKALVPITVINTKV